MKRIHIPMSLYKEIEEYCIFNNIKDVNKELIFLLKNGFNYVKFGLSPFSKGPFIVNDYKEDDKEQNMYNVDNKQKDLSSEPIIEEKGNISKPIKSKKTKKSTKEVQSNNIEDLNVESLKPPKKLKKGITIIKN